MLAKLSVTSTRRGTWVKVRVMSPELLLATTLAADRPVTVMLPKLSCSRDRAAKSPGLQVAEGGTRQFPVRIVGEVFDAQHHGIAMITGSRTLAAAGPGLVQPDQYDVGLRHGTSPRRTPARSAAGSGQPTWWSATAGRRSSSP